MMGFHGAWGMGFGWILWVLLFVLLIWGAARLFRPGGMGAPSEKKESALDILKRRYANGEIDKQEFEEKKHDLAA